MGHLNNSNKRAHTVFVKDSSLEIPRGVTKENYNKADYGETITGSFYPLSSSIKSDFFVAGHDSIRLRALKNTLNENSKFSKHYLFSSELGDKSQQELRLISVPSVFYGSSIKKGTLNCKWYVTGTLIAQLQDIRQNGELIQTGPSGSLGSGSVAGVVLYNEGFIVLTGSWNLHSDYVDNFNVNYPNSTYPPSWKYFMVSGTVPQEGEQPICGVPSSSFEIDFDGTNYIETITMLARAEKGELNHSNNKTYIKYGQKDKLPITSSTEYIERSDIEIKNIINSPFNDEEPKFEKITYISKVGIYDEEKNLIAIAKLATPVRKKTNDSYLFKIKLDI